MEIYTLEEFLLRGVSILISTSKREEGTILTTANFIKN